MAKSIEERFWSKVDRSGECWLWLASVDHRGYGQFRLGGRTRKAHQVAWELLMGTAPLDLEPDHLCRERRCVRPEHLEWVTHRVNILRGQGTSAHHARKTHCPKGHAYDETNTYHSASGHRQCRACARERANSGVGQGHNNAVKTHCPHGHEYTPENTYVLPSRPNVRYCRACQRIRVKGRATRRSPTP